MTKRITGIVWGLTALLLFLPRPAVSQFEEEMFFETEEWVQTAAKRLQLLEEVPAAVTVITAEEIRNSGAANLGDLLRRVPGIEVMSLTPSDFEIGARGQNKPLENGVLVLVNGRSVYEDFFGIVIWSKKDFGLEQIERIEVVRGPGSVLYGANAFHAVVNIILKNPVETAGGQASLTAGPDTIIGNVMGSAQSGRAHYLVSAGWNQSASYEDSNDVILQYPRGRLDMVYDMGSSGRLIAGAGIDGGDYKMFYDLIGFLYTFSVSHNVSAQYEIPNFYIRAFWKTLDAKRTHAPDLVFDGMNEIGMTFYIPEEWEFNILIEDNVFDLEAQQIVPIGWGNLLTLGANYRFNSTKYQWYEIGEYRTKNLLGAYLQHEYEYQKYVHTYLGVRYDHHPLTGHNYSPRGSILVSPFTGHTFRFSYGKSFRNPIYIENHLDLGIPLVVEGGLFSTTISLRGDPDLDPEELTSFEAGYQASLMRGQVKAGVNAFYNDISNLIYPRFPDLLESALRGEDIVGFMQNSFAEEAWGVEAEMKYRPRSWLSLFANYTYTEVYNNSFDEEDRRTPRHKVNGGITCGPLRGASGTILVHHVGETYWPEAIRDPEWDENLWMMEVGPLDAYTLVNVRLAYQFLQDRMEVALNAFNLFDDDHYEFPRYVEKIGQRFTGTARISF